MLIAEQLTGELSQVIHTQCYDKNKPPNGIFPLFSLPPAPLPGIDSFSSHWNPSPFCRMVTPPLFMALLELLQCFALMFTLFQYFGS